MKRIAIISDTHGFWDEKYVTYMADCDEIWHAGDIGSLSLANAFEDMHPRFRAVCGNIDDVDVRARYPELLRFKCEGVDVLMKHIGGYPGHYDPSVRDMIRRNPPQLFVDGHSHILRIMPDKKLDLLHINPGAAGMSGWQLERTIVRLTIDGNDFRDCEVVKLGTR